MRIVLVRHGQTEWNRVERFRGRVDLPLNATGVAQARAVAEKLASLFAISAVYTSPLRRSVQTAKAIAARFGVPLIPDDGFTDIDYGQWQGLSPEEVAQAYPDLYRAWLGQPHLVRIPGGESLLEVRERATKSFWEVAGRHNNETIAIVSHQVVCKVLMGYALGLDNSCFWRLRQDNAAINLLELEGGLPVVVLLNDTCHWGERHAAGR